MTKDDEQPNWMQRISERLDTLIEFARVKTDKPFKPRGSLAARTAVTTIPAGGIVDGAIQADPNRRRLLLWASAANAVVGNKEDVRSGNGVPVPTGGFQNAMEIKTVAALSLAADPAAPITFYMWIEGD